MEEKPLDKKEVNVFEKEARRVQKEIDAPDRLTDEDNKCGVSHRNDEEMKSCAKCKEK